MASDTLVLHSILINTIRFILFNFKIFLVRQSSRYFKFSCFF